MHLGACANCIRVNTGSGSRVEVYSLQDLKCPASMKKLINDPQHVVRESLAGFALAHADLVRVSFDPIYVVRRDAPVRGKVGVVSGGGSGHEPMHGGYVGRGMLDAAVPGQVFTSPTPDQIEAATRAVDGGAGVLHI